MIDLNESGRKSEKLVCESIDKYHGLIVVKLLNGNYSAIARKVKYKLVDMDYMMNYPNITGVKVSQVTIDELLEMEDECVRFEGTD